MSVPCRYGLARSCCSGERIGMPLATLASYLRSTPCCDASESSRKPFFAMTSLFAVTMCLPWDMARRMYSCAGSSPPMSSMTMSISGASSATWPPGTRGNEERRNCREQKEEGTMTTRLRFLFCSRFGTTFDATQNPYMVYGPF